MCLQPTLVIHISYCELNMRTYSMQSTSYNTFPIPLGYIYSRTSLRPGGWPKSLVLSSRRHYSSYGKMLMPTVIFLVSRLELVWLIMSYYFEAPLKCFQTCLNLWNSHFLTLEGKIVIANHLISSSLWYFLMLNAMNTPRWLLWLQQLIIKLL